MGYKWVYLKNNTPKNKSFSKIAFAQGINVGENAFFSTLPNRTSTGDGAPNTEENGYPFDNRIWLGGNIGVSNIWICGHNISDFHPSINVSSEIGDGKTWIAGNLNPSRYVCQEFGSETSAALNNNMISIYVKVSFEPSKSSFRYSSTGGTDTFELTAESNWTATTESNWVHLSQTTGTTGGTLTLTCDMNTGTARTATITFTNADADTFNITVNQKAQGIMVPIAKRKKSGRTISKEYYNGTNEE